MGRLAPDGDGTVEVFPIDLTSLVATIMGISIVLIPVIGLTARFALTPVVEALSKVFEARGAEDELRILHRRVELQEQEIALLQQAVSSLADGRDFERQLESGRPADGPAS